MEEFEALYRAVESRDSRWDGRVFVGVTSTGIFCRPICPVPMPRREHVRFYRSAAAAPGAQLGAGLAVLGLAVAPPFPVAAAVLVVVGLCARR